MTASGEYPPPPAELAQWALDRWGDAGTATLEARRQANLHILRGDWREATRWAGVADILSRLN